MPDSTWPLPDRGTACGLRSTREAAVSEEMLLLLQVEGTPGPEGPRLLDGPAPSASAAAGPGCIGKAP